MLILQCQWYGASVLFASATETASPPDKARRTASLDAPLPTRAPRAVGPPSPTFHNVIVSYSEPNTDVESADNEDQDRDSQIANSCVTMIEDINSDASAGCCSVDMMGEGGTIYSSAVGVAVPDASMPDYNATEVD